MSASLVGSEMCIRDSQHTQRARRPPPWLGIGEHRSPTPWCSSGRGRRRAVSYTHLTLPTICSV
eukprot:5074754-Alexandrium_andersonii.AAC.1